MPHHPPFYTRFRLTGFSILGCPGWLRLLLVLPVCLLLWLGVWWALAGAMA